MAKDIPLGELTASVMVAMTTRSASPFCGSPEKAVGAQQSARKHVIMNKVRPRPAVAHIFWDCICVCVWGVMDCV